MTTLRKILFSLLALLLFLGGVEGVLRLMDWPAMEGAGEFEHNDVYWIQDGNLQDKSFPHREMDTTFSVSTDGQGLRAPLHAQEKPEGVFRVLLLGCSTTFGWGVDDGQSFPSQLEALARAEGHDRLEVINGGQPGYTSFQGIWFWDEIARHYDPDLVVLGYVVQDARKAAYSDLSQAVLTRNASFLKDNFLYRWRLYLALKTLQGQVALQAKERSETGDSGVYRVSELSYLENLRSLRIRAEETGAKVMHFGFPLEREGYTVQHRRLLRLEAEASGLPFYDPSSEIEAASGTQTLYFERDKGHPNAAGYSLIAQGMYRFLLENQLLFR